MTLVRTTQAGTALVTSLLVTTLLFGISGSYLVLSYGGYENSSRELATVEARLAAEDGIQLSIAELKSGVDAGGDGLGNLTTTAATGGTVTVTATNLGGNLYRIHSVAVLHRARCGCEVLVDKIPLGTINFSPRSAISAKGPVQVQGSIVIDGRDHNALGTTVVGPGTYGIASMSTITNSGNAKVGGHGIAPAKPPPATTIEPNSAWTDGIDNDGDGSVDEELFDGIDNDGDGVVDEDTHGFPTTPDVALHLAPNTLKNAAISTNTYFTSAAQVDACIAANGGRLPGGKIIYCDFSPWQPANLGSSLNSPPSILVQHNATSTAQIGNVTGAFSGLVMVDAVQHFSGNFILVGGIMAFSSNALGNAFGLGNAQILFSSAVLGNLPTAGSLSAVRIKSWHRSVAQ
jgi:hypothetical protein